MECIYCGFSLPPIAKFCPKCVHQVVCRKCEEPLFKDASICISCGEAVNNSNASNGAVNNIEFTENENGKSFKASFTDNVAGNVVQTFAQFLPINNYPQNRVTLSPKEDRDVRAIEIPVSNSHPISQPSVQPIEQKEVSDDMSDLEKIFRNKNGATSIYDTRIKAKSKMNFVARIILLYLYYKYAQGANEVSRAEVIDLVKTIKLYDSSFRAWLSQNKTLVDATQTTLELRPQGIEEAQKILSEFNNPSIIDEWELKSSGKSSPTKDESKDITSPTKTKASKKSISYQIISSLNLKPSENKSLTDFCSGYTAKNNFEYNLLFVYYLQKILRENHISVDHLYTCYKELGLKVPNIRQSLWDTKKRTGWVETENTNDLKVPIAGENHLEHNMIILST